MKILELVSLLDPVHGSVTNSRRMSLEMVSSSITIFLALSAMELPSLLQPTSLCRETASLATSHLSVPVDQLVQLPTLSLHLPHSLPRSILHHQCLFLQISSILVMATPCLVCFLPMAVIFGRLVLIRQVSQIRQILPAHPLRMAVAVVVVEPL